MNKLIDVDKLVEKMEALKESYTVVDNNLGWNIAIWKCIAIVKAEQGEESKDAVYPFDTHKPSPFDTHETKHFDTHNPHPCEQGKKKSSRPPCYNNGEFDCCWQYGNECTNDEGVHCTFLQPSKKITAETIGNSNVRIRDLLIDRDNINKRLAALESDRGFKLREFDKRITKLEAR